MEIGSLEVKPRTDVGKGAVRRLRRTGFVPAVVYGIHDPTPIAVDPKALEAILGTRAGANAVFQLYVGSERAERPVIIKELQRDPVRGQILHADFFEIRMDETIEVSVPIVLMGESPGVKLGGTLSQLLRELDVECLPNAIPDEIAVDVSGVELNDVIHVRDISLPEGLTLISDPDDPVLTVEITTMEEEAVPEEEAPVEEGAEAEAPKEEPPSGSSES